MSKRIASGKPIEVGAQDLELKNSPVAWESEEDTDTLRESIPGDAVCYFNDRAYADGTMVLAGDVRLRCDRGLWVPAGPGDPDNP